MEQSNNKIELNKTNVGVDAHIDPHNEGNIPQFVGADATYRPHFEGITKNKNGITLITLVITVILLLILAVVMVNIIVEPDGAFDKAENATERWNNKTTAQDQEIQQLLAKKNEISSGTTTPTTPPIELTLNETTGEIEVDATLVLTASLNVTPTQNIVWTSSDDTIATVVGSGENNKIGTITGVSAGGPVTITAKYGDKTATCSITVNEKKYTVTFYDEDKTTVLDTVEVEEGGTAVYTGQTPTKASSGSTTYTFSYWETGSGSKASLENITENLDVYAYYTSNMVCFIAGTKVLTENGLINIEDISVGIKVYSMNEATGEVELKKVTNTFENLVDKDMCKVYIKGEVIESTSGHKYYEVNKGWVEASKLNVGDILLKSDRMQVMVERLDIIKFNGSMNTVYNLEIEDNHNYFVGENSVLVHNDQYSGGAC